MAAPIIPVKRSHQVEVWHDTFTQCRRADEDHLIAVVVPVSHRIVPVERRKDSGGWPSPVLPPASKRAVRAA